jgi:hypothetical protein
VWFRGQEDVKKSIWPKSKLMQNVYRRPSDRLLGILATCFRAEISPHQFFNFFTSSRPGFSKILGKIWHYPYESIGEIIAML